MCAEWKTKHNVLVGFSWGTLPANEQKLWASFGCDTAFIPQALVSDSDSEWCLGMVKKHKVVAFKTWGSLPFELVDTWRKKNCDISMGVQQRVVERLAGHCSTQKPADWRKQVPTTVPDSEPVVAVLAASTTRTIRYPSTASLALCNFLLRSLVRTAECGYKYVYVLGYDVGDPYFDDASKMKVLSLFAFSGRNHFVFCRNSPTGLRNKSSNSLVPWASPSLSSRCASTTQSRSLDRSS
jgi:hypothetical protein